jgi:hypothetical protein
MQRWGLLIVAVLCVSALHGETRVTFKEPGLDKTIYPRNLAAASDRIWFTDERFTPHAVGFFTLDTKRVTTFAIPCDGCDAGTNMVSLEDVAAGADGNAWFIYTEVRSDGSPLNGGDNNFVGRLTPSGQFARFRVPTVDAFRRYLFPRNYNSIRGGPGGMWFTENSPAKIGRISYDGIVAEFPLAAFSQPSDITAGPDGNVWFTLTGKGQVGRITPSGTITLFTLPGNQPPANVLSPLGIVATGDELWIGEQRNRQILRMTANGAVTKQLSLPGIPMFGTVTPENRVQSTSVAQSDSESILALYADGSGQSLDRVTFDKLTLDYSVHWDRTFKPVAPYDVAAVRVSDTQLDVYVSAVDESFNDTLAYAQVETDPAPACPTITLSLENALYFPFQQFPIPASIDSSWTLSGRPYPTSGFSAAGGSPPYQFAVTEGTLPPGVELAANGQLTGVPTGGDVDAAYPVTVTATDSSQCSVKKKFVFYVFTSCSYLDIIWLKGLSTVVSHPLGEPASLAIYQSGMSPLVSVTVTGLPNGMHADVEDGKTRVTVRGTPANDVRMGQYPITVTITDRFLCTRTKVLTLRLTAPSRRRSVGS